MDDIPHFILNGSSLSLEILVQVARRFPVNIEIHPDSIPKIQKSRQWVESVQKSGKPTVYGVNTGFGSKASVTISPEHARELQRNLIMSHSAGTGNPLPVDVVRAAMLMRANTLVKGYSGVRLQLIETLLKMLEKGVTPWIPEQGSVGASGDLAPLSHLALVISKDPFEDKDESSGKAYWYNTDQNAWILMSGKAAMKKAGIPRLILEAKEGLALNNGTQISTAVLALALHDARQLVKHSDIAMALSLEALQGISSAFREEIHQLRPFKGQLKTAENIRRLTEGSSLLDTHPEKVQDAYSLRCYPQVVSPIRDTLQFIEHIVTIEMNATNDNPIIFSELPEENKALSGGNFHGEPIALAADFLSIALTEMGNISERRIFRLSDKNLNEGLPSFLIPNSGLSSGLMVAQYTAAALASENKALSHPASVDSIPTCENQEDHVSMAPIAARKTRQILENVTRIIAIELLYAAQGVELRCRMRQISTEKIPHMLGKGTAAAFQKIREQVSFLDKDRPLFIDIQKMVELIKSNKLLTTVEQVIGEL